MRRDVKMVLAVLVLGALGFAAASIATGQSAISADTTGTTATAPTAPVPTVTVTATATTTQTVTRTVVVNRIPTALLCHRVNAKRYATIRVKSTPSVLIAHLGKGDLAGRCTAAKIRLIKALRARRGR